MKGYVWSSQCGDSEWCYWNIQVQTLEWGWLMLSFLLDKHREVDCWLLDIMHNFVRYCHIAFHRDCTFSPFIGLWHWQSCNLVIRAIYDCCSHLCFTDESWCWLSSHVPTGHSSTFFCYSFEQIPCPFFYWGILFITVFYVFIFCI